MAEFSELVRIKKRLCAKYKRGFCNGCPLGKGENSLCGIISVKDYSDFQFKELEDELLSWAAEYPEPVYPSWALWLCEQDIATIVPCFSDKRDYDASLNDIAYQPIPADIAEKLGIEPKEG